MAQTNSNGTNTALVPQGQAAQQQALMSIAECRSYGELLAQSGFFEGRNAAQCAVLVMAGHEIGVPPFAAMQGIFMIKGRPYVGAHILASKIKASGRYDYRIKVSDNTQCTIVYLRLPTGEVIGESTYTWDMAVKARLTGRENYQTHAADMLYARAMARGAKRFCPDVINGLDIAVDEPQPEREPAIVSRETVSAYMQRDDAPLGGEPDVIDGDAREIAESVGAQASVPQTPPVQPPANGNGAKPQRPYDPEMLREGLRKRAEKLPADTAVTDGKRGVLVACLDEVFALSANPTDARRDLLAFLFGAESSKDLTGAQCTALYDWLKPRRDSGGLVLADDMAHREAVAAQAYAIRDRQQPEMPGLFDETPDTTEGEVAR